MGALPGRSIEPTCVFVRANIRADRQIIPVSASRAFARPSCLPWGRRSAFRRRNMGHLLRRAPPALAGRRAFRRSTAAIFYAATALLGLDRRLSPHVIRAALAPPFIQTRPAIEGRPLIGVGQW